MSAALMTAQPGGATAPARMNYIELLNRFWQLDAEQQIADYATRLYFFLVQECNRRRWVNPFELADKQLIRTMGGSVNTLKKHREDLAQRGLLTYQAGGNGAGDKCVYALQTGDDLAPLKVSNSDTLSANKVSGKVSNLDTFLSNKVSEKVSNLDTIYKEENKTSSVVENKTPNPGACAGEAGKNISATGLLSDCLTEDSFLATTPAQGGGSAAALRDASRQVAGEVAALWKISEQKNFRRWAQITRFCFLLAEAGQLEELRTQFAAYSAHRKLKGISTHSLDNYLGHETTFSPAGVPYADGAWADCDWAAKLQEEQQASLAKAARPAFGAAPVAARVSGSYATKSTTSPKL